MIERMSSLINDTIDNELTLTLSLLFPPFKVSYY